MELYNRRFGIARIMRALKRGRVLGLCGPLLLLPLACSKGVRAGTDARVALAEVHLARGLLASNQRDTTKAEFYFDEAIRLDPRRAESFFQKGLMHLNAANRLRDSDHLSHASRAVRDLSTAINLKPQKAVAFEARGWAHLAMGRGGLARDDFERAARLDPKFLMSFSNWSKATGTAALAIEYFNARIELSPKEPAWRYKRGCAFFALGENKKALSDFYSADESDPRFVLPEMASATVALGDNDLQKASALLRKAREKSPNHPVVFQLFGELMLLKGEPIKADEAFSEAIRLDSTNGAALVARGVARATQEEWHAALIDFQNAQILEPARLFDLGAPNVSSSVSLADIEKFRESDSLEELNPIELLSTANQLVRMSQAGEQEASDLALILYDHLVAKGQEVGLCFLSRAVLLQMRGDLDGALQDFNRAIELEPRLSRAFNNRGMLYSALGQIDAARSDYETANALAPAFAWPLRNLGLLLRESDPERALEAASSALCRDSAFVEAYEDRAWVYERLGNRPAAATDLLLADRFRELERSAVLSGSKSKDD